MRQTLLRLALLAIALLLIFGVYRLLTIDALDAGEFFDADAMPLILIDPAAAGDASEELASVARAGGSGVPAIYLPVVLNASGELVEANKDAAQAGSLVSLLADLPDVRFVVDLREPTLQSLAALLHTVDSQQARGRVLAIVDDQQLVDTLRSKAPDLATAMTSAEASSFLLTSRLRLTPFYRPSAPALLLPADQFSRHLARAAHSRGIAVIVLAANDRAAIGEMFDQGAAGVFVAP